MVDRVISLLVRVELLLAVTAGPATVMLLDRAEEPHRARTILFG
jgi:hypothetical protein